MASMNWSLQLLVPTSRARLVFFMSLSTVFCQKVKKNIVKIQIRIKTTLISLLFLEIANDKKLLWSQDVIFVDSFLSLSHLHKKVNILMFYVLQLVWVLSHFTSKGHKCLQCFIKSRNRFFSYLVRMKAWWQYRLFHSWNEWIRFILFQLQLTFFF